MVGGVLKITLFDRTITPNSLLKTHGLRDLSFFFYMTCFLLESLDYVDIP